MARKKGSSSKSNSKAASGGASFNVDTDGLSRTSTYEPGTHYVKYGNNTTAETISKMLGIKPGKYTHGQLVNAISVKYEIPLDEAARRLEADDPIASLQQDSVPTANAAGAQVPGSGPNPNTENANSKTPKQNTQQQGQADPPADAKSGPTRLQALYGRLMGDGKGGRLDGMVKGSVGVVRKNPLTFGLGLAGAGLYGYGKMASDETKTDIPENNPRLLNAPSAPRGGPIRGQFPPVIQEPANGMTLDQLFNIDRSQLPGAAVQPQDMTIDQAIGQQGGIPAGVQQPAQAIKKPQNKQENNT